MEIKKKGSRDSIGCMLGVRKALSWAEGTVATSADTVTVWHSGACVVRQPRGMATVAVSYTVTRGTAI